MSSNGTHSHYGQQQTPEDNSGTSLENLQAREFWKEEHLKNTSQQPPSRKTTAKQRPKSAVQNYQRTLSTTQAKQTKQRRQPQTSRRADPDSDDEGPATFVNSAQVLKDWKYYRRSGALWTDPDVHVPESRQHLLGKRPDLEAKHDRYVQSVIRKEKRAAKRILDHRSGMRYATQTLMRERQEENMLAEERALNWGTQLNNNSNMLDEQDPDLAFAPPTTAARTKNGILKKDWKYYRRQGALWTDLVHLPAERLHFVLRPKIIKMDREATMRIKEKYEHEIDLEHKGQELKMKRANKIRQHFLKATVKRKNNIRAQWGREPPFSLGHTGEEEVHGVVPVNNRRIAELALPKNTGAKRPSTSVGQSYTGLLSSDTTVGPLLHEHWGRQGYDIHQNGKYNVTDSITSTDEVRVSVSRGGSGSRGGGGGGGGGGSRGGGGRGGGSRAGSRARTSRPRSRARPGYSNRSNSRSGTRPVTAPNGTGTIGFTGSQSGGYQGPRADPYSPSGSRRNASGIRSRTGSQTGGHPTNSSSVLINEGGRGSVDDTVGGRSNFVIEMTPSSHSVVSGVARDAADALMEIEQFDLIREKEEEKKRKGGRHENWFAKPYVSDPNRRKRPSTAGLVNHSNYFNEFQ